MSEFDSIREILDKYGKYTGLTHGNSMEPLIYQGRDNIIIVKTDERLKKYDIPVYEVNGKYIMHRIVEVYDDHYTVIGDNRKEKEYVTDDMICGRLVGFYRRGKHYVDLEKDFSYKLYSRLCVALYPIRPVTIFVNKCISYVRRHLFKK